MKIKMEVEAFPRNCRRRRAVRKKRSQFQNYLSSFLSVGNDIVKYRSPLRMIRHVYEKKKYALVAEESSKPLNPSSQIPRLPRGLSSKEKAVCTLLEMDNHIPELSSKYIFELLKSSGEGVSLSVEGDLNKLYSCPTSSKARPRKDRKRKTNPKDESRDSEVTVPRRIHFRGQAKRVRTTNSSTITNERGKLDSAAFLHYLMHIWSAFPEEMLESVTYFDPLWFEMYASETHRAKVLNWIKAKRVFSKKYVFVPIVIWSHWSLLIFCNLGETLHSQANGPCMLLLDSMHSIGPSRLEPLIRSLLFDLCKSEEKVERKEELKKTSLLIPKVPQQKKGEECGFYILFFIKLFLESTPEILNVSEGYPHCMKEDWFTAEQLESFCKSLDAFPLVLSEHGDSGESDVEVVSELDFSKRA